MDRCGYGLNRDQARFNKSRKWFASGAVQCIHPEWVGLKSQSVMFPVKSEQIIQGVVGMNMEQIEVDAGGQKWIRVE